MKFLHIEITDKEAKKLGVSIVSKKKIWKELAKIENSNMHKRGTSYCHSAVYDAMLDRCIILSSDKKDLIFKKRYDKMVKQYKGGKIHSPYDFKIEQFDPLAKLMLTCPCEC
jgi:hypothetical protein